MRVPFGNYFLQLLRIIGSSLFQHSQFLPIMFKLREFACFLKLSNQSLLIRKRFVLKVLISFFGKLLYKLSTFFYSNHHHIYLQMTLTLILPLYTQDTFHFKHYV